MVGRIVHFGRGLIMTDAATLTRVLRGKWNGRYGLAYCPAHHNTRTPALSLANGDGGRLLAHCFAGCDFAAIIDSLRGLGLVEGDGTYIPPSSIELTSSRWCWMPRWLAIYRPPSWYWTE